MRSSAPRGQLGFACIGGAVVLLSSSSLQADVTFALHARSFEALQFQALTQVGELTGSLTGVSVNAALVGRTGTTLADDLCVYVQQGELTFSGLLQCGGAVNLNATHCLAWPNGHSGEPDARTLGTLAAPTAVDFATADLRVWLGSGVSAPGAMGTWTGTVTLHGVSFASELPALLSVVGTPVVPTTGAFTVDVNLDGLSRVAVGAQASVAYDPTLVEFVGIEAGTEFPLLAYTTHDALAAKITFAAGVAQFDGAAAIANGNIAKLTFRPRAGACVDADAITLSIGSLPTRVTDVAGQPIPVTEVNGVVLTALDAPQLLGVPTDLQLAADAGTTLGAAVSLSVPRASDSCGHALLVTAVRSDGLPLAAYFAIGTTTIAWSATDAAGTPVSATTSITVLDHQLATVDVDYAVGIAATRVFTHPIRLTLNSGEVVVTDVDFVGTNGAVKDIAVPVRADYQCIAAKDATHTNSSARALSVVGTKWVASAAFQLVGGDSNDDNSIDVLDFGTYLADRGAPRDALSRSNFNRDAVVNNGDFSFIAINFLQTGSSCSVLGAPVARASITVRELRRLGLGHLALADLDQNGVVDAADLAHYAQFGAPRFKGPRPAADW